KNWPVGLARIGGLVQSVSSTCQCWMPSGWTNVSTTSCLPLSGLKMRRPSGVEICANCATRYGARGGKCALRSTLRRGGTVIEAEERRVGKEGRYRVAM